MKRIKSCCVRTSMLYSSYKILTSEILLLQAPGRGKQLVRRSLKAYRELWFSWQLRVKTCFSSLPLSVRAISSESKFWLLCLHLIGPNTNNALLPYTGLNLIKSKPDGTSQLVLALLSHAYRAPYQDGDLMLQVIHTRTCILPMQTLHVWPGCAQLVRDHAPVSRSMVLHDFPETCILINEGQFTSVRIPCIHYTNKYQHSPTPLRTTQHFNNGWQLIVVKHTMIDVSENSSGMLEMCSVQNWKDVSLEHYCMALSCNRRINLDKSHLLYTKIFA